MVVRPKPTQAADAEAIQYANNNFAALKSMGATVQVLVIVKGGMPKYMSPGDWLVSVDGGLEVLTDAEFKVKYEAKP